MVSRIAEFHDHLADLGIPVISIRKSNGGAIAVILDDSATQAQVDLAEAERLTYDHRPRRSRPFADIRTDIQALNQSDRNKLLTAIMAQALKQNYDIAEKVGINISGREPVS